MKASAFDYTRPTRLDEALRLLQQAPDAKIIAGGQTLGPMLNLRLVQPALLVDITRIRDLAEVREENDATTLGAITTHAAIEDGRAPDPTGGFLARVARGIAYRAVRARGTIGGSLAHADPAADWLACLAALDAEVETAGATGTRRIAAGELVRGAMETVLASDEIVTGIRIMKFSRAARFGYHKICRKTGEFAEAIGVAVHDPDRGTRRLVVSTAAGAPIVLDGETAATRMAPDIESLKRRLRAAHPAHDAYELNVRAAALCRAIEGASAP
jgi:carbon-monoxide dehydrogenase medium subunit